MLANDIREAIDANLTSEVGTVLKERLTQADADAEKVKQLGQDNAELIEAAAALQLRIDTERDLDKQKEDQNQFGAALELRDAVLTVREEYALKARDDMLLVVKEVFSGPASDRAFTFSSYGNVTLPNGQNGSLDLNGDVTEKKDG